MYNSVGKIAFEVLTSSLLLCFFLVSLAAGLKLILSFEFEFDSAAMKEGS